MSIFAKVKLRGRTRKKDDKENKETIFFDPKAVEIVKSKEKEPEGKEETIVTRH